MLHLSHQVTQLSKELQDMMLLLKPLLTCHRYDLASPDLVLHPSPSALYSNSSGFSSTVRSQAPSVALTCPVLLRPNFPHRCSWPESNLDPPRSPALNLQGQTVHASLSLSSLRDPSVHRGSDPHLLKQPMKANSCLLPHQQALHADLTPFASSPPSTLTNLEEDSQPDEPNIMGHDTLMAKLSLQADAGCSPHRVAEHLGITLMPDHHEGDTCSVEMVRTSTEDSGSDSIQFIDDDGTNL